MGTVSCSQPTDYQILKMGVYDGVYQLDMSQADPNWAALHKEMGIPEADTKAMISGGNVHTMTVMENKDGSFTTSTNNTVVPHHNSSFTSKPGEIKKMEKPFPCTVSWNYKGENESVMNIEMGNGKKLVNEYCMNNYGFTCTTSMEGSSLKARAVFWKVSPKEDGYYEMETEKGMFPVLQQLMPQMTEDAWKELIKNGGVAMKLKVDKTKAVMEERMSGGKSKTVVYPFEEAAPRGPRPLQDGDEDQDRQDRRLRDELHRARGLRDYDRWRVKRLLLLQETWRFRGNLEGVL